MKIDDPWTSVRVFSCSMLCAASLPAAAQNAPERNDSAELVELRQQVEAQTRRLDALKQALAEQERSLAEMSRALNERTLSTQRGTGAPASNPVAGSAGASGPGLVVAQQSQEPVGKPPEELRIPDIAPLFDQPGVLTAKGKYVLEPGIQYAYSSSNRVALVGYTIIPALLVGLIDVREVRRTITTAALTARFGVTNRFEVEAKVPYVYSTDNSVGREILQGAATNSNIFDASGKGLGDIEMTGRYQFNDGGLDQPYFIGSLRFKSKTGKDPFEVETSRTVIGFRNDGIQTELPTGSGFYSLQPAVTMLYPSDPAVFFGTVSYLYTFGRDNVVRRTDQGDEFLGTVKPGGVFGFNFGMGIGLNEKSSFSVGYDHSSVAKTKVSPQLVSAGVRVQLGTLLVGYSYRLNDRRTVNVSLGAGLTRDTPDVTMTVRMPMTF